LYRSAYYLHYYFQYKLGQAHRDYGDLEKGLFFFKEALMIERQTLGNDDPSVARTLNDIGNIHLQKNDVVPMMEAFVEALRIYKRAGLSVNNLIVVGHKLYAFGIEYPEASPAA